MHPYRHIVKLAGVALLSTCALALAQPAPELAAIAEQIKRNHAALTHYAWETRVAVSIDGEQKKVDVFQVRYDADGQLQKTRIGGEADAKKVRGPMRKRAAKKKKKEIGEFVQELKERLAEYMNPTTMQKALKDAFAKTDAGTLRLQAQDVLMQGDSVLLEVVEATKQPMSLRVETSVDESPVVLAVTFQKLNDGTNYTAKSTIDTVFDKKKVAVVMEDYNHIKQGG